jgi:hypothetical protein
VKEIFGLLRERKERGQVWSTLLKKASEARENRYDYLYGCRLVEFEE